MKDSRLKKLELLKQEGLDPYPPTISFKIADIAKIKSGFKKYVSSKASVGIAGRLMAKREHGGSTFADIFDGAGKLQVFLSKEKIGEKFYALFQNTVDIGDFIAVRGTAFYTKRKEATLNASRWEMIAKSLLPLPEKWHSLQDIEEKFRKRYLDILMNAEVKQRFALRSNLVCELRKLLEKAGFMEVETPILQPLYGGALAEPFLTHHRMLDIDMYLRIAPELYLKRLLAAGFKRVYEIGKNFRNEGIDATHNPEFTTIELYEAYKNADYLKKFIIGILSELIKKVLAKNTFRFGGQTIKFSKNVLSISFWQVIERYALMPNAANLSRDDMALYARRFGLNPATKDIKEKIALEIFSKICRPKIIQPTFIVNYPVEISPLAKNLKDDGGLVDRFQMVMGGIEIINGFSELNDPQEQKRRFEAEEELRNKEDKETHPMDKDFIEMLEYGMPPAAGLAISIDRLTMLLTNTHNIKEVILFPTMKPKV